MCVHLHSAGAEVNFRCHFSGTVHLVFLCFPYFKDLFILMYVCFLHACKRMPTGARRRHYTPGTEVTYVVSCLIWVLGTEPGHSAGAAGDLNPEPSLWSPSLFFVFVLRQVSFG